MLRSGGKEFEREAQLRILTYRGEGEKIGGRSLRQKLVKKSEKIFRGKKESV